MQCATCPSESERAVQRVQELRLAERVQQRIVSSQLALPQHQALVDHRFW